MSNDIAIRVENVSKRYIVGELVTTGDLKRWLTQPLRKLGLTGRRRAPTAPAKAAPISQRKIGRHEFWALKDINFEVRRGEVLGIIGANGAGKSTLLKILSRITAPTTGRIDLYGRVASLLEVGTGFHPELTGRENIYLNGSILGMNKAEVDKKFDEIVDFAGVEEFIDTPIKRYSSGMRVRLGFAVAAHLEPEILIIDEVLAVGDVAFQKKCLGKMQDVAQSGRTVLFVSHNMAAITALCSRCILLQSGAMALNAQPAECVNRYMTTSITSRTVGQKGWMDYRVRENPYSDQNFIDAVRLFSRDGQVASTVEMGSEILLELQLRNLHRCPSSQAGFILKSQWGDKVASLNTGMTAFPMNRHWNGSCVVRFHWPEVPLTPGVYSFDISLAVRGAGRLDAIENAIEMTVVEGDVYGTGYIPMARDGRLYIRGTWSAHEPPASARQLLTPALSNR